MDQHLNKKIDEAMQSLDGIGKSIAAGRFSLHAWKRGCKERKAAWEVISSFVAKPIVAFACICLIIMINAAVILSSANCKKLTDQQNTELGNCR